MACKKNRKFYGCLFAAVLVIPHLVKSVNASDYWRFERSAYLCLRQNLDAYTSQERDPVIIFLKFCPETDAAKIMHDSMTNSSSLPKFQSEKEKSDSEKPLEVITLTKSQLLCIATTIVEGSHSEDVIIEKQNYVD